MWKYVSLTMKIKLFEETYIEDWIEWNQAIGFLGLCILN